MSDLLLRAIRGEKVERFPVWLMRQAGRYMKEYRQIREKVGTFLDLCKNVDLAVEVSLLPERLLGVDAIIMFSDILVPLEGLGIKFEFLEGEGPKVYWEGKISPYDPKANAYVYEIIKRLKKRTSLPVIGFSGAPFTLASYVIEGSASRDFRKTKVFMWERSYDFRRLLESITDALIKYLSAQISAGADVVQIFDSWALHLSREDYEEFALPFVEDLISEIKARHDIPVIYFFRGSSSFLDLVLDLPADVLSVDWSVYLPSLMIKSQKAFQGNLDPALLYASEDTIKMKTLELLRSIPRKTSYIFNLGHGLAPDMEFPKVKLLVETVKKFTLS